MFENIGESQKIQNKIEDKEREDLYAVGRKEVNKIYKSFATNRERVDIFKNAASNVMQEVENPDVMLANIEACVDIENKKEFMDAIFQAALPMIDLRIDRPEIFIPTGGREEERSRVNKLLTYEIKGDYIDIHIDPEQVVESALEEIVNGLHILAEMVRDNEEIKKIEGESWIISRHPKIIERLGFVLDEENKKVETGVPVRKAHMMREEFLDRYLKK